MHMAEKLMPWAEAVGDVQGIKESGDAIILSLRGTGDIILRNDRDLISKLKKAMGQRIGILRTDIPGREYILKRFTRG